MININNSIINKLGKEDIGSDAKLYEGILLQVYERGFRRALEWQSRIEKYNWIATKFEKPSISDTVQILIYDDSGDTPSVFVECGRYYGDDFWIVDNDLITGQKVIGWQRLEKAPSIKSCKELMDLE